jgi:hypothetical protein
MTFVPYSSQNWFGIPGLFLIDEQTFDSGEVFGAIQLLIHEPLHDWNQFGAGHGDLGQVVGPTEEPPGGSIFTRMWNFLSTAKCGSTTLKSAILDKVGPHACGPKPSLKAFGPLPNLSDMFRWHHRL